MRVNIYSVSSACSSVTLSKYFYVVSTQHRVSEYSVEISDLLIIDQVTEFKSGDALGLEASGCRTYFAKYSPHIFIRHEH